MLICFLVIYTEPAYHLHINQILTLFWAGAGDRVDLTTDHNFHLSSSIRRPEIPELENRVTSYDVIKPMTL